MRRSPHPTIPENSRIGRTGHRTSDGRPHVASEGESDIDVDQDGSEDDRPSKSQRKRDMTALQGLGEELVRQPRDRLLRAALPDDLRAAVFEAQAIRDHEGRRRQLQYVGKLMRRIDAAPIQAQIAAWRGESHAETARLHTLERWRERLLGNDRELDALCTAYPAALNPASLQHLRALIRQARKEQAEHRPPRNYRELFKVLKTLMESSHAESDEAEPAASDESAGVVRTAPIVGHMVGLPGMNPVHDV